MAFLLDTNVWIDLERGDEPNVIERAQQCQSSGLYLSTIVLGEIEAGIQRSSRAQYARETYNILLRSRPVVGVDSGCATIYGRLRAHLLDRGQIIGANDLWIAAQSVCHDLTLVTANVKEFSRVPELTIEDWR